MLFEWDEAKSAKVKAQRGVSFEELEEAIDQGGLLGIEDNGSRQDQYLLIVRCADKIWAIPSEFRGEKIRFTTAYQSRKWRKKYGN